MTLTMNKLLRITTVPISLHKLLQGQLDYMLEFFEVFAVTSPNNANEVSFNEHIQLIYVEMSRTISPLKDILSLIKLLLVIRQQKPQIIHTHTPKAGTLGIIAAWLCRVLVRLHTVAGLPLLETSGNKRKVLNFVEKLTYACATKVYPNSFGLKDIILQNKYCKPEKLYVIGNGSSNGINTQHISMEAVGLDIIMKLRRELRINSDDFVFIFVGRLVKDKGINELAEAFSVVHAQYPSTKLILVGNYEADLDALKPETIYEIESNDAIIFVGYQSDVRPYLAVSHTLVFPSYREGFPNVPMQALAMEIPAIVTDINGCNEIVMHEKNGLIIPPKNTEALIKTMKYIINNEDLYKKIKSNARESIVSRYEQSTFWNLLKKEYDNQLKIAGVI